MLKPVFRKRFEKDVKRAKKRHKDVDKLKKAITLLLENKPLPALYREHVLSGNYSNHWECHLESDWLLIYKRTEDALILERTGSHSDLFK